MLVKTRLQLVGLSPIIFAVLIGCAIGLVALEVERMRKDQHIIEKLLVTNYELNTLSQELLLYGETRIRDQLQIRYTYMGQLLEEAQTRHIEHTDSLSKDYQALGNLIALQQGADVTITRHIAGTLLVKYQDIRTKLVLLSDDVTTRVNHLEMQRNIGILVLLTILAAINATFLILFGRRLFNVIANLNRGVEMIQAGNHEHQIPVSSNDELATLTHGFNSMNSSLHDLIFSLNAEITEHRKAEESLQRLNRELRAISNCNQILMRVEDEPTLLDEICRIVCNEAGYCLAWVGYVENDAAKSIRPVAGAGADDGYLAQTKLTWDSTELGNGPWGMAIRNKETVCIQDLAVLHQTSSWLGNALQRGYQSCIVLPLYDENGNSFGILTIFSAASNVFCSEETRLLEELAGDLAFGITVLRARIERRKLEQGRLAHLRFVQSMDRINLAIQGTNELEKMMSDVLDTVLAIFDCDRAWLLYPCDPEAASWSVPMERTKPEYPGASDRKLEIPMSQDVRRILQTQRDTEDPVSYGPGCDLSYPEWLTEQFGTRSQLAIASYPKTGKPWMFGMHQCSHARVWTQEEKQLFQEINRRLTDALSSLLSRRDLQESETKYRRIFDTTSEGIWGLGPNSATILINTRMAEMLGYSIEEMIGRPMTDFMFEEDIADHLKKMQNRYQSIAEVYERRYQHKDGQTVWTLVSATPVFDAEHRFNGSFGMFTDITERKQAEQALRLLNEELEQRIATEVEKNQAKDHIMAHQARLAAMGEMLSNISHQWRQPLNNVSVLIQNLQIDYEDGILTVDACRNYVQECLKYLMYMSRTIESFRTLHQPEYERQLFHLCQAVSESIALISEELEHNGIEVTVTCTGNAVINGYKQEFCQVLLNIIRNSREVLLANYTKAPCLDIFCSENGGSAQLVVRDNGGGVPPEIMDKIFDPYFTSKFKSRGTGMGLYISKMIITNHMGGSIAVNNARDGAEVIILLPVAPLLEIHAND